MLTRCSPAAVLLVLVAIGLGGCGSSHKPPHCANVKPPKPRGQGHLRGPFFRLDPRRTYVVHVSTSCGDFEFRLFAKQSPKAAVSVYYNVKHGFYDGLTFHRVVARAYIQGGDPKADGYGQAGYTYYDPPPRGTVYRQGDVAMAKAANLPRGYVSSQFFIVTAKSLGSSVPPDYALAGHVISGQDVVDAIGGLGTNPGGDGKPTPTVVMRKVTVSEQS